MLYYPSLEEDPYEVIDLIEEINHTAGDQIDFITLRENVSNELIHLVIEQRSNRCSKNRTA